MRTAEQIIKEYLERGYSVESLRVLAESRSEPLCSQMLAILSGIEDMDTPEVACEAASPAEASRSGDTLFFVADDDAAVSDEDAVDFDIMADAGARSQAGAPAFLEESVADIYVDEAGGVEILDVRRPSAETAEPEHIKKYAAAAEQEIWSRRWTARSGETRAEEPETDTPRPENASELEAGGLPLPVDAAENAASDMAVPIIADRRAAASSDGSSDYLPGSVIVPADGPDAAPVRDGAAERNSVESAPNPVAEEGAAAAERDAVEKRINRKARRRKAREEKKQQEKTEPAAAAPELPEIVLTRSEGTDTMIPEAPPDEHAMIIATGGLDLRTDAYKLLSDENSRRQQELDDYEPEGENERSGNVILFNNAFASFAGADDGQEEDEAPRPLLRMLPPVDSGEAAEHGDGVEDMLDEESIPAAGGEAGHELPPLARLALLKAIGGAPSADDIVDDGDTVGIEKDHAIVAFGDESEPAPAREQAAREEVEREYQERLDEFARRLLEVQAAAAESEARTRERQSEVEARDVEIDRLKAMLDEAGRKHEDIGRELAGVRVDAMDKQNRLDALDGLRDEHKRLYDEYEDVRKAYNEVVGEVMPGLQRERDELALTVERQGENAEKLRTSLNSSRKRLAAGYALGAAACAMMIALPVANWMKSGEADRELAMNHQETTELRERLEKAEAQNIQAEKQIFELERDAGLARMELAKAEDRSRDLSRRVAQINGGTPTRTSTMALQAASRDNGELRYNNVRDPAGSIDEIVANNRRRADMQGDALASAGSLRPSGDRIPLNSVAIVRENGRNQAAEGRTTRPSSATVAAADAVKAKVKAGEGVAQVVYRVLGTRDPEVINWVIRENSIKKDRRGNPRIYPEQELRLPKEGRMTQAASAAGRRR